MSTLSSRIQRPFLALLVVIGIVMASFVFVDTAAAAQITELPADSIFLAEDDEDEGGSEKTAAKASWLYAVAMGEEKPGFCLTCDFIVYFMAGIANFSQSLFDVLAGAFPMLVSAMIAIWIGYRAAKLMTVGGEDGVSFIKEMVMKLSLFAVVFLLVTGGTDRWLWRMAGPEYMGYALTLAGDVRDGALDASNITGVHGDEGAIPFRCTDVRTSAEGAAPDGGSLDFVTSGMKLTCVTERSHMVGIATGIAIIGTAFSKEDAGGKSGVAAAVHILFTGIMKFLAGGMMLIIFTLSAIWMIFLLLDIIVEIMLIAAFSPAIATAYLWRPTRGIAVKAIKMLAGSMVTAVALSVITVMAYFLLSNVVQIYNAVYGDVAGYYAGITMTSIAESSRIEGMREFIARTQETNLARPQIPMNFSTPWFYYLCMTGLAIFALGKKMMAMISQVLGVGGQSELANNATAMTKKAAGLTAGAAFTAASVGGAAAMMLGPSAVGLGAGAGRGVGRGIMAAGRAGKNIFGSQ